VNSFSDVRNRSNAENAELPILRNFHRWVLYGIFFLSGAAGLIYEITWMRIHSLILGSTTLAGTLILAAFFSGLALGAYLFGKWVDRIGHPLVLYGILEIGLGIFAIFSDTIFTLIDNLFVAVSYSLLHQRFVNDLLQFVILWIVLLVPTTLMGGTLPILSKYLVRRPVDSGGIVGKLYGYNTLGAVIGTVLTAFFTIRILGVATSITIGAILNLGAGLIALILRQVRVLPKFTFFGSGIVTPSAVPAHEELQRRDLARGRILGETQNPHAAFILVMVFVSGLTSLASEVLWFRILSITLDSSVQSFGIVLSIFIGGFALGSLLFSRIAYTSLHPLHWLSGLFIVTALYLALVIPFLDQLPYLYYRILRTSSGSWVYTVILRYGVSSVLLLPQSVIIGGVFPLAIRLVSKSMSAIGGSVGQLYAWNTIGGILGSILGGLLLIPMVGVRIGFLVLILLMAVTGAAGWREASRESRSSYQLAPAGFLTLAVFFVIFAGKWQPGNMIVWWGDKVRINSAVLFYEEGLEGNVAVVRRENDNSLFVGKKLVASEEPGGQKHLGLLSHIPMLLHEHPRNSLVIGLATGITLNSVLVHGVEEAECVEINPVMLEAVNYFRESNDHVVENPRTEIIIQDARHFLRGRVNQYDCLITDPIHPADAHSNNLYSLEYYQMAARALRPGGLMSQWLPVGDLAPREAKRIMRTFDEAFAHVSLWMSNMTDLILIGSNEPLQIHPDLINRRLADRQISAGVGKHLENPTLENFLSHFILGPGGVRELSAGIEPNTDDKPILEYEAPKHLWDMGNVPGLFTDIIAVWDSSFQELTQLLSTAQEHGFILASFKDEFTSKKEQLRWQTGQSVITWCRSLEELNRFSEAVIHYREIFELYPDTYNPLHIDASVGMSLIYGRLDQPERAEEEYLRALNMAPSEVQSRNLIARAFVDRGRYHRARNELRQVLELDPANSYARQGLQWLNSRTGPQ